MQSGGFASSTSSASMIWGSTYPAGGCGTCGGALSKSLGLTARLRCNRGSWPIFDARSTDQLSSDRAVRGFCMVVLVIHDPTGAVQWGLGGVWTMHNGQWTWFRQIADFSPSRPKTGRVAERNCLQPWPALNRNFPGRELLLRTVSKTTGYCVATRTRLSRMQESSVIRGGSIESPPSS